MAGLGFSTKNSSTLSAPTAITFNQMIQPSEILSVPDINRDRKWFVEGTSQQLPKKKRKKSACFLPPGSSKISSWIGKTQVQSTRLAALLQRSRSRLSQARIVEPPFWWIPNITKNRALNEPYRSGFCLEGKVGSLARPVPGILEATLCKGPLLGVGAETTGMTLDVKTLKLS